MPHGEDPKANGGALMLSNLKLIELCEGGPYELRGFLIRMTPGGPQIVGDMVLRIDHPNLMHHALTQFRAGLKALMRNPADIDEVSDPRIVQRIDRSKLS